MESLAAWYGLKDGHLDFFIQNDEDAALLFARSQLDDQLQAILRKSFRTQSPPKFVLYGVWGVGKTHTLRHMGYVINHTSDYNGYVVFKELPDIKKTSTFQVAHAALLDALGLDIVKAWMVQFQTKHQSEAHQIVQSLTQSGDIARAFTSLIGFGDTTRICWDWLRGLSLSAGDARSAGLPPVLDQSTQLVSVLRMLGRLCKDVEGKILIFMMDEAFKLKDVTDPGAIAHWLNAFKLLSDRLTKEVGVVISASDADVDDMAEALKDVQVRSRFGESHYILLQTLGSEEASEFLRGLLGEWIDPAKRQAIVKAHQSEADGEGLDEASFPFTKKALTRFVDYTCRNGGITNPRDIQHDLDDILNRAIDAGRHIASAKYLEQVFAQG